MPAILKFPVISLTRRLMKLKENNFQGITFSNLSFFFLLRCMLISYHWNHALGGEVVMNRVGGINKGKPGSWPLTSKEDLIQIIILTTCCLSQVISQRVIVICVAYYICFCAGWSSLSWCITKTNWKERGDWYFFNKLSMWFEKKKLKFSEHRSRTMTS